MKATKDGITMILNDETQARAFKRADWVIVDTYTPFTEEPDREIKQEPEQEIIERKELLARADMLGISYPKNIPTEKLREMIASAGR